MASGGSWHQPSCFPWSVLKAGCLYIWFCRGSPLHTTYLLASTLNDFVLFSFHCIHMAMNSAHLAQLIYVSAFSVPPPKPFNITGEDKLGRVIHTFMVSAFPVPLTSLCSTPFSCQLLLSFSTNVISSFSIVWKFWPHQILFSLFIPCYLSFQQVIPQKDYKFLSRRPLSRPVLPSFLRPVLVFSCLTRKIFTPSLSSIFLFY